MKKIVLFFLVISQSGCIGASLAGGKASNPKAWDDACRVACKDPIEVTIREIETGRGYRQKFAILSLSSKQGCECGGKQYLDDADKGD